MAESSVCAVVDAPHRVHFRRSVVWEYFGFKPHDKSTACCKICKTQLVYKTGSTSNLMRHIEWKHPHITLKPKQSSTSSSASSSKSPKKKKFKGIQNSKINEMFVASAGKSTLPRTSKRHKEVTRAIGVFMATDLRPFCVVDNNGFRNLMNVLEPKYDIPSRTHFSDQVIPNLYDETRYAIVDKIKIASAVALTTDGWTSRATESYITITAHVLTDDFQMDSMVLQTRELPESHTADNLAAILNTARVEWKLFKDGQLPSVTTDNAANVVNAVKKLNLVHVRCLAHTLNLATQKGMKVKGVVELLKKIRRVVGFFHRSTTANALLKSAQIGPKPYLPPRKLIQDVETRRNSSYDMMTSFVEQRAAVSATLVLKELKLNDKEGLTLTDAEFETVEEVIKLLAPFKKATTALCSETYPTVSLIFSMKKMLLSLLEPNSTDSDPVVKEVKEIMLADLRPRYEGPDIESYLLEASLLDPRFKTLPYATVEQKNVVYENLKLKMTTRGMVNVKVKQEDINDQERSSDSDMPQLPQLLILPGDEEVTTISVRSQFLKIITITIQP